MLDPGGYANEGFTKAKVDYTRLVLGAEGESAACSDRACEGERAAVWCRMSGGGHFPARRVAPRSRNGRTGEVIWRGVGAVC